MIGLSLSKCVLDIAKGEVSIRHVSKIITSAVPDKVAEWRPFIERHCATTWKGHATKCTAIMQSLLWDRKIEIARYTRYAIPNIGNGHWVIDEKEIEWEQLGDPRSY